MRIFKKTLLLLIVSFFLVLLFSCNKNKKNEEITLTKVPVDVSSDSLYVRKIENLNDDFILGMDASSVISLENAGVKFYDYDGKDIEDSPELDGVVFGVMAYSADVQPLKELS